MTSKKLQLEMLADAKADFPELSDEEIKTELGLDKI
jgi:hypothetical protein